MKRNDATLAGALLAALSAATVNPLALRAQALQLPVVEGRVVPPPTVAPLTPLLAVPTSELRRVVERYDADRSGLYRRYDIPYSTERRERLREFYTGWQHRLRELDFDALSQEGRIDYVLLDNELRYELGRLEREQELVAQMAVLLPFGDAIMAFQEARRRRETLDPRQTARQLHGIADGIAQVRSTIEEAARTTDVASGDAAPSDGAVKAAPVSATPIVAFRAVEAIDELRETLEDWYTFYAEYDPLFTWWTAQPYERVEAEIEDYASVLREQVVGIPPSGEEPIVGDPIGRDALLADLVHEMIPYSPEELVAIAEEEFAWCQAEMVKAANEMGYGDDWRAALEHVKTLIVDPGRQRELVRDLAYEAVVFIEARDLVTIPPLAKEMWRIRMMSPERQQVNPFFTGGEVISVSYPTAGMSHEDKLMSMRGNNIHFSRATVFHELIPGHHLQGFVTDRYNSHREVFSTPFWGEGWALYWEMLLWDAGFQRSPEDRVGMLFWRMHRAARIIFSLSFHLGTMTPQEAIDFLVERVGHEYANAEAEVRRSFNGSYSPLYQVAYMIGGLQIRALHEELVGSGRMTDREFHDGVLRGGRMPIEMVRARLVDEPLMRDYEANWRFAGDPLGR